MTPSEWAGVIGAILAVGVLAERIAARLSSAPSPPRETIVPSPHPSQPAIVRCECERDIGRMRAELDANEQRAQSFREQMIGEVREMRTILAERTRRGAAQGGDRGSTT